MDLVQLLLQCGQRFIATRQGLPQFDDVRLCCCTRCIGCVKELLHALLCCCNCLCYCCLQLCLDSCMRYSLKGGGGARQCKLRVLRQGPDVVCVWGAGGGGCMYRRCWQRRGSAVRAPVPLQLPVLLLPPAVPGRLQDVQPGVVSGKQNSAADVRDTFGVGTSTEHVPQLRKANTCCVASTCCVPQAHVRRTTQVVL